MKNRTVASLLLALALLVPGVSAQDRGAADRLSSRRPQEADVITDAIRAISRMHMEEFTDSMLWEAAIDGLIASLDDPYAELFTPVESTQWEQETTGNYSGIGLQITILNEEVTVTGVFRGFPASQAGLLVGDVIVGVNGNEAFDWDTQTAADSIRGPAGTNVNVRVQRSGYERPLAFDITRAEVHVPAVEHGLLRGNIGYVIMDRVARGAADEMSQALEDYEDARGLIIDLRRNPGGFLDESLDLADLFLERGATLASTVQRSAGGAVDSPDSESYLDRMPVRVPNLPVVILVDEFTASGAEILAGALQDYDRALVLGTRSFGKGVVQTVMALPHDRRLRFTTGVWLTPLGRSLQRGRDRQMRPLEEDLESLPRVTTPGGRELVSGGGIFPDIAIESDTLRLPEQEFVRVVSESQYPLGQRLQELGFNVGAALRTAGQPPALGDEAFAAFLASLVSEGLPADLVSDPMVQEYLRWQGQLAVAQRMDDIGAEADFRSRRDRVLAEAIRLLSTSTTQADLFRAAEEENASRAAARTAAPDTSAGSVH
ncbi:MAG: S41 family peptidase [Gemmatimonadota bacterium]|nr:S41 family peptidase [Gemmatimonadota bacterium]MDH3422112.1 S41 family peptidase [Gemmatimonadota bacterium]